MSTPRRSFLTLIGNTTAITSLTTAGIAAPVATPAQATGLSSYGPDAELLGYCAAFDLLQHDINASHHRGDARFVADDDERDRFKRPLEAEQERLAALILARPVFTEAGRRALARTAYAWFCGDFDAADVGERLVEHLLRCTAGLAPTINAAAPPLEWSTVGGA